MFFGNGLTLGKIFGITIRIDYSWFIIFFLITQSFVSQYLSEGHKFDLTTSIILGIVTSLLVFTCALIHELSHSVVGNRLGARIKRITLFVFGGAAELSGEPERPDVEFKMAAAGPLSSIVLGFLMWGLLILAKNNAWSPQVLVLVDSLRYFNFAVGIFNLLPGYPLDGGRILRSILWWRGRDLIHATAIAAGIGKAMGFGFILIGLGFFIFGDALSGVWFAFIGFFLNAAAGSSATQSRLSAVLSKAKVGDLMTKQVESISSNLTISDLIEHYLLKRRLSGYPVLKDNKLIAMAYLDTIAKKNQVQKDANVLTVSTKLNKNQIVTPQTSVLQALKIMGQYRLPSLPVVEDNKLVGIISQTDISYFLTVKSVALE